MIMLQLLLIENRAARGGKMITWHSLDKFNQNKEN